MNQKSTQVVLSNLLWRFFERCGAQGIALIVSIVLARILGSTAYGTVALVTVFTTVMQVFVDSGLGSALIQKKDADNLDFSSVFWFNLVMCSVLYAGMFFIGAPLIAAFYQKPELVDLVRVLSLVLVISGLKNVQQAYVSRHLLFKRFFFSTLVGTIAAAVVGILMACLGFGVWALVAQHLVNTAIDTLILWITVKWRPQRRFSLQRMKALFSYGWKLLVSALIDTLYKELRQLIIGKIYTEDDLAYYNQASKYPKILIENVNSSIDSVLLPTMSKVQSDAAAVKNMTRRAIKTSTFIIMPMMVGLAVCASPLINLLLGDDWMQTVPYLRIFCFTYAFYPIHTANLNAIKAMGHSNMFLKLEIAKKIVGLIVLVLTMRISVMAMALSLLVTSVINQLINSWPNKRLLQYGYLEQLRDILPQILISLAMGCVILCVPLIGLPNLVTLLIQIPLGVLLYWGLAVLFHIDSYEYMVSLIKGFFSRKHKKKEEES